MLLLSTFSFRDYFFDIWSSYLNVHKGEKEKRQDFLNSLFMFFFRCAYIIWTRFRFTICQVVDWRTLLKSYVLLIYYENAERKNVEGKNIERKRSKNKRRMKKDRKRKMSII